MAEDAAGAGGRVVEVFAPVGVDGLGRKGTGWLLGAGLVLTARHVIQDAAGTCEIRALGEGVWVPAAVLWRGNEHEDGALLRFDGPPGDVDMAELGWLACDARVACEATGFPWAQLERRHEGGPRRRRTEHIEGRVDRVSGRAPGAASDLLTIHVDGSAPAARREKGKSPWAGMSGAGVLCGGLLVGVVTGDPARFETDRLLALPLTRLVSAPGFAEALGRASDNPIVMLPVEAQGVLDRPYEQPPAPRARQSSAFLLGARYGVVPFRPRPELDKLVDWAHAGDGVSVAVVSGQGGIGKTRLARQLCAEMACEGWVTGMLTQPPDVEATTRLAETDRRLLIVVDYAETRAADIVGLLALLARSRRSRRIVLLARQVGDWWTELPARARDPEVRELLNGAQLIAVGAAEETVAHRTDAYQQARRAFARHIGVPAGSSPMPDLSNDLFETLLFVHMAALGALPGAGDAQARSGAIRADLVDRILAREERYWRDSARGLDPPLLLDARVLGRAVAVATLASQPSTGTPTGETEAAELLEVVPDLDSVGLRRRVARWLHGLYRNGSSWIAGLEPDLLGEALVARAATHAPDLAPALLGRADAATATRALTVLARGARHHEPCRVAISTALDLHLHDLAPLAIDVALQLGDPAGVLLAGAMKRHPDATLARGLLNRIPTETVSLREAAAVAAAQALDGTDSQAARSGLLVEYYNRLAHLGRHEEALEAIDEAVQIRRTLARAQPGVFLPSLAMALNNQSNGLHTLGRHDDALAVIEDAVDGYRKLAADRPDMFLSKLAGALENQASRLSAVGRREEAVGAIDAAVTALRQLGQPPDFAHALANQSVFLSDLGRREDALVAIDEAARTYRLLADANADGFLPALVVTLTNQSMCLSRLGRHEDALAAVNEAVAACRPLAEARPDAFLPALAKATLNQSVLLGQVGRREEALAANEESVAAYRLQAEGRPDVYLPDLATALGNHSICLSQLGRREGALAASEEAVRIRRVLAAARPEAYLPDLAMAISNQSGRLSEMGRPDAALVAIEEAVGIRRELAAARPDAFLDELVTALNNQALCLGQLGRPEEALTAISEGAMRVGSLRPLAQTCFCRT